MLSEDFRIKMKARRQKLFSRNGIIVLSVALIAVVTFVSVLVVKNISSRISTVQAYVHTWSALTTYANSAASEAPAVQGQVSNVVGRNYPIVECSRIDKNVENILILGIDKGLADDTSDHRSDCIIVASINRQTHTAKLVSVMRDIRAYFPAEKTYNKINAAYELGGPGNTVNVINYDFGLDIQKYVVVDFSNFKKIVDAAGGVDMKITAEEAGQIKGLKTKKAGTYHLDGAEALDYSRIRHIDSDFYRVQRQKKVILKVFYKYRKMNLAQKSAFVSVCLNYIKTNMTTSDVLYYALTQSVKVKGKVQQFTLPSDGMYTQVFRPVFYFNVNWAGEKEALQNYLYGDSSSAVSTASGN